MFAVEIRRERVKLMRAYRHWQWHLDEVFVKINRVMHYLWLTVGYKGEVLESSVTRKRGPQYIPALNRCWSRMWANTLNLHGLCAAGRRKNIQSLKIRTGTLHAKCDSIDARLNSFSQLRCFPAHCSWLWPDGPLCSLKRRFLGIVGIQGSVRRFALAGDTVEDGRAVLEIKLGQHGNREGISICRDAAGALPLKVILDNKFRFLLPATLVGHAIPD